MNARHRKSPSAEQPAVDAMLLSAGLRRTPVRLGVLTLLANDPHPLSAQQILEKLPRYTDAVTVYRSLTTLTEKGLLHRIVGDDRVSRFAIGVPAARSAHQHAHFVCDDCGTVECLAEVRVPPQITRSAKRARGYDISYSEVLLHGTCPRCPKHS